MEKKIDWEFILQAALKSRRHLIQSTDTDCLRLFHGYEEGCPGVVIEKFGDLLVVQHKIPVEKEIDKICEYLEAQLGPHTIVAKAHQSLRRSLKDSHVVVRGQITDDRIECTEGGVKYDIRPHASHNLGLYLDTRSTRRWLRENSDGRRILNLFAFTGSLGLSSLIGGASDVIHLDKSAELLPRLKSNYDLNLQNWDARSFLRGDIYKHLPRAMRRGQRFDGIILDPPPKVYASSHAEKRPDGQDFRQLVSLCSKLLTPDGWLMCCFHRFDRSRSEFENDVLATAKVKLKVTSRLTSGIDFPEKNSEHKLRVSVFKNAA